ncbi:MAG: ABC transporter permease subunit [Pseudophaeobacter sp. bin_em_oilr2.035]|uniref:ABC transporter permease subunit n=1 Tax=Phaeobacter gallaeciensis TaxID=60890 RepID=A0ABD4X9Z3_9RHOB|nr:ABC transporter permease subunit [Phaeobacter gallaeciensis]MDF1771716.1 ABC transporter permease subunit [Pseudophaeobacter sp. bin_em_oilr2.035]MDE4145210.1 ABC transporter permease subunit [Phaeobacter gallaeciensis]MDE4157882.1 ABC transporter permease subunit [Phaeobacter gallaeciensis]MDE4162061.1 ABC transporter permease subunit [Phaeobacter gallaeciensis]MDE4166285.1 ABC transporter permease subunit [Phaeobacter gallaeciensis]
MMTLSKGSRAALVALVVGILCLALEGVAPWLVSFPKGWVLPATDWVGSVMESFLALIKPAARMFSALMAYPMEGAGWILSETPWPLLIAATVALGWRLGGLAMALMAAVGLGAVLASGYWPESMNTLALVSVSVPLALVVGGAIGVLANEYPRVRAPVQALLDVMQTVPTFAYLTPLLVLFGFGPVVGLIASAIYAAPPMARNVMLGLERIEPEIKEAAVMAGGTRMQQLFQVEIPAAATQIMVGVNQCLMAALSMVIIAAVIGGFDDIGWEVLLTMRKAQFGASLLAGFVIVIFAILIDRMSGTLADERRRSYDGRVSLAILVLGAIVSLAFYGQLQHPGDYALFDSTADRVDAGLSAFTSANAELLTSVKNGVMFYVLLPLRIGLDQAVLPFTWGFVWTTGMSLALFAAGAVAGLYCAYRGKLTLGVVILITTGMLETGISQLPWPFVLVGVGALSFVAGGVRLAALSVVLLITILLSGLWERALLSLYLSGASVFACAVLGGAIGLASAVSPMVWRVVRPICDMLQTIPLFVFLIPVLMVFQIGEFSAFLAIMAYAIVPMIRYTRHGLTETPAEMIEAATASGATRWQMMRDVRAPYAAPTILLGLNQTILYAFAMLVIAALIGTTGLGQSIYLALGQADVGLGISAGAAMAILALIADRIVQGFAEERRHALGL